jgi:hypothetical protein
MFRSFWHRTPSCDSDLKTAFSVALQKIVA